jgi:hypothetical protein
MVRRVEGAADRAASCGTITLSSRSTAAKVPSKPGGPFTRIDKGTYTLAGAATAMREPAQQKLATTAKRTPARKQTAARKKPATAKSPGMKRTR